MIDRTADSAALVVALGGTIKRIEGAALRLTEAELTLPPDPQGWSANQILWHVRAVADVYGEQIERMLHEDEPRWRHVSPRARMKKARYDQLPFAESLAAFARQRSELLALLEQVPPAGWRRAAVVRVEKRESRLTLQERVRGMANHEEVHCAQMEAVAAAVSSTA